MSHEADMPPSLVRRAADIARGPHACPSCECPTYTEPPVPWTGLRDYVARCHACERPIAVHIDRERILRRRRSGIVGATRSGEAIDPDEAVAELLDQRGRRAFVRRLAAAACIPGLVLALLVLNGATMVTALIAATVLIIPCALWAPATLALTAASLQQRWRRVRTRVASTARTHRHAPHGAVVEIAAARWDQWMREERLRERERFEQPDAVLRELERVLDPRELNRVRALAERGDVPPEHLEDLLRYRSSWSSVA